MGAGRKVKIDDFLFFGAGSVTGRRRHFRGRGRCLFSGAAWVLPALGGLPCSRATFFRLGWAATAGLSAFASFLAPGSVGAAFGFCGRPRLGLGFSGSGMGFFHSCLLYSVTETGWASGSLGMSGGASFSGVERIAERSITFADGAGPPPTSGISACSILGPFPAFQAGSVPPW